MLIVQMLMDTPYIGTFNNQDYNKATDYADPRLFLTIGIPGLPYEFNSKFMMDRTATWSRSNGLYGYYVTLKQNVDPEKSLSEERCMVGYIRESYCLPLCRCST